MPLRYRVGIGVLLIFSFGLVFLLEKSMTVTPRPEDQSSFFKSYDPSAVIHSFQADAVIPAPSVESAGSWGFASYRSIRKLDVTIDPSRRKDLFTALQQDAARQLTAAGGKTVEENPEKQGPGFHIGYQIGPTRGAILVKPASGDDGKTTLKLEIAIQEMWSEALSKQKHK